MLLFFESLQVICRGRVKGAGGTQKHGLLESPGGPRHGSCLPTSHSKWIFLYYPQRRLQVSTVTTTDLKNVHSYNSTQCKHQAESGLIFQHSLQSLPVVHLFLAALSTCLPGRHPPESVPPFLLPGLLWWWLLISFVISKGLFEKAARWAPGFSTCISSAGTFSLGAGSFTDFLCLNVIVSGRCLPYNLTKDCVPLTLHLPFS